MTCNECLLSTLPFFKTRDLNASFNTKIHDHPSTTTPHLKKLNENKSSTFIAHLNVQALMSAFNKFSLMLDEYQFDIITLNETWVEDYIYQQNCIQINGYNAIVINRINKRGGGVGFYVKDQLEYKICKDFTSKYESLEILLIEILSRNRNSPTLICVAYQPGSIKAEKLEWLEKSEALMTDINTFWNGTLILTGDFNIDLLKSFKESTKRYKDILHMFSLQQHVTKPTRKGKTLIDYICSNIPSKLINGDVIYTDEISDDDCPYTSFNIKEERFQLCYKYIRIEKNLNMNNYISDFKKLPTNLVYIFDEPDDKIDVSNNRINQCICGHSPVKKVKFSLPAAPWMRDPEIIEAKSHLENLRNTSHDSNHTELSAHQSYQAARNNYKKNIRFKKATFLTKST